MDVGAIYEAAGAAAAVAAPASSVKDAAAETNGSTPEFVEVPVALLAIGDRVLVRPGDRVPIDGVVVEGRSTVDESLITGESLPAVRAAGDAVIGGTINQDGRLVVRVSRTGGETALAQIVGMVEKAQSSKPPVQKLADRISAVFVPVVLGIALVTAAAWLAWGHAHDWPATKTWAALAKAVCSVLIIACPCALGLAIPAALMVGTGRGAQRGILVRDIDALQKAESIEVVALDKTGTITRGRPAVARVVPFGGLAENEALRIAASAEQYSEHPLACAIVAHARGINLSLSEPASFANEPGYGVVASIDGREILVGGPAMMARHGMPETGFGDAPANEAGTRVLVAEKTAAGLVPLGAVHLRDTVKSDSAAAISELRRMGLKVVLLTGDNRRDADLIAAEVGIDDVRADVRPGGKAEEIRRLQAGDGGRATGSTRPAAAQRATARVAMVGDGINDAPALASADLGIAIGSGSDVAKEAGDIVLVSGSLHGVATAIRLSRATMRTIRQNLALAFLYNVLAIPLAAFGLLNPLIAAAAMALSDVTVIGNALLLRRAKIDE